MPHTVPIQINVEPEILNEITDDLKNVIVGVKEASENGIFDSEKSEKICSSLNKLGNLIFIVAKGVETTIEKAEKLKEEQNNKK